MRLTSVDRFWYRKLEDARQVVGNFVSYYNTERLHSALGYVTPVDKLEGREKEIFSARDRKLAEARELRKQGAGR